MTSMAVPRAAIATLDRFRRAGWVGFHLRLVQLGIARLLTHLWSPLPMVRL